MAQPPTTVTVYADDTDASMTRLITSRDGTDLTFTPSVAIGPAGYTVTGAWLGVVSSKRELRVPVADLAVGTHRLYLQVPGFNDLDLGYVKVQTRT